MRPSLRYVPALDGIRALAVAAVLAFHLGYGWASGGFLGVSVFFTLSGYLITSLLLAEHRETGGVALGGFYRRRAARLLPASLLGLLLALAVGRGMAVAAADLRGDLLAGLGQVVNWRWLQSSQSYEDLFAAPSPVLHYWSLAVEEQFYLVFPLLFVWAMRRSVPRLRGVLVVGVVASWALLVALVVAGSRDAAYYGTPTRFGEILVGALLACVAEPATLARRLQRLAPLGLAALGGLAAAVVIADTSGRWTYALWLPATALLSVLLIVGATAEGSPASRLLAAAPLVWLGRISYGVYVFHWPVFLYLTPERTGLGLPALAALRLGVTLSIAVVVHRLLELPVQRLARAPLRWPRRSAAVGLLASWALVGAVLIVGPIGVHPPNDLRAVRVELDRPSPPAPGAGEPPRVAFFGDSTAAVTSLAVAHWGEPEVDILAVTGADVPLGCGLELPGERRWKGRVTQIPDKCFDGADAWGRVLVDSGARVAVIQSGAWEVTDHRFANGSAWRHLGDPELDAAYLDRFLAGVDSLLEAGADRVVWLTSPTLDVGRADVNHVDQPESDPARSRRYNELVREVAARRPQVVVVDYGARIDGWSDDEDAGARPDGIHLTDEAALAFVEGWLGPELLGIAEAVERPAGGSSFAADMLTQP